MASIVLGIMGKKQSGKDTFAARLVSEHGYTRLAFADALKESLLELDPIVDATVDTSTYGDEQVVLYRLSDAVSEFGWDQVKEDFPEVRSLLQRHGVAMRNHVGEDVWVDAVARKIRRISGPVVVTDVRFPNEADLIEETFGGVLARIVRPGLVSTDTHISETALDGRTAHVVVTNSATVAYLHREADLVGRVTKNWK